MLILSSIPPVTPKNNMTSLMKLLLHPMEFKVLAAHVYIYAHVGSSSTTTANQPTNNNIEQQQELLLVCK